MQSFCLGGEYNSREGGHEINIGRDRRNHGRGAAGQPVNINFTGKLPQILSIVTISKIKNKPKYIKIFLGGKYGRREGGSKIRIKGSGDNGKNSLNRSFLILIK